MRTAKKTMTTEQPTIPAPSVNSMPRPVYDANPAWVRLYDTAWRIALDNMETPDNPAWLPQMSCMPGHTLIWQWDSCFMALFSRYSNGTISALNNLDNLYRLQRADGYISMTYNWSTDREAYGERINPPLYAWVEMENYRCSGDHARLARVYPTLVKYFQWVKANRRRANGLYYFEDTGSSGMDNSPRSGYAATNLAGSDVCFIDLSCQQLLSARKLADMAGVLGRKDDADAFNAEADALAALINRYCWSDRTSFYYDCFIRSDPASRHNLISCMTVAAFWAIISAAANESQMNALAAHLQNPDEFGTPHPVPSLSRNDPNYTPLGGYWCGSVWAPTNYMVVRGLVERGWHELARDIACKHLTAMTAVMDNPAYAGIWECYAPEPFAPATSKQAGGLVRDNFVGWSGLGPIAMFIENIIGLEFDAPANTISWRIIESGRHGLENIRFNGKTVSLVCEGRRIPGKTRLHVECDGRVNLRLVCRGMGHRATAMTLDAGRHQLDV